VRYRGKQERNNVAKCVRKKKSFESGEGRGGGDWGDRKSHRRGYLYRADQPGPQNKRLGECLLGGGEKRGESVTSKGREGREEEHAKKKVEQS